MSATEGVTASHNFSNIAPAVCLCPNCATEGSTVLDKMSKIAQELAEQDDQLWPL